MDFEVGSRRHFAMPGPNGEERWLIQKYNDGGKGDAELVMPAGDSSPVTQTISRAPDMHDLDISDLIEVLDEIFGDRQSKEKRERLQHAVRRIVYWKTKKLS